MDQLKKVCPNCSKNFETTKTNKKYCNSSCKIKHNGMLAKLNRGYTPVKENFIHHNIINNFKPLPGDVVYIADSKDEELKINTLGIITGIVGFLEDQYEILFNPYLPVYVNQEKKVSCASGIKRTINVNSLFHTGKINMLFEYTGRKKADDLILVNKFITVL